MSFFIVQIGTFSVFIDFYFVFAVSGNISTFNDRTRNLNNMNSTLNDVKLKTVSLMFIVNRFLGLVKWQPGIGQNFYRSNSTIVLLFIH